MSVLLVVAGFGVFVAGLVTIAFGIPIKEFSFGDTLVVSGAVVTCTGLIMISLSVVVRELRRVADQLGSGVVADRDDGAHAPILAGSISKSAHLRCLTAIGSLQAWGAIGTPRPPSCRHAGKRTCSTATARPLSRSRMRSFRHPPTSHRSRNHDAIFYLRQ